MKKEQLLTAADERSLLRLTKILAGEITVANAPAAFSLDLTPEESEAQAQRQARELADRRNAGRGGRVLIDDAEGAEIRSGIREWLRRTGRLRKHGVNGEDY